MESGKASFPMSGERKHCRMDPPAWMILPIAREKQKTAPATREPGQRIHTAGRTNRPGRSTFHQDKRHPSAIAT